MVTDSMMFEAKTTLHNLIMTRWLTEQVFSPKWWGTVGFIVLSYVLIFTLLNKKRLSTLLLFGSLMTVSMLVFDIFAANFVLYSYKTRVFPVMPSPFLYDLTIIPLYYMLVYQYADTWSRFMVLNAVLSAAIAFAFFPALTALNMFVMHKWSYWYFFVVIFTFAMLGRAVTKAVYGIEERYQTTAKEAPYSLNAQPAMKPLPDEEDPNP